MINFLATCWFGFCPSASWLPCTSVIDTVAEDVTASVGVLMSTRTITPVRLSPACRLATNREHDRLRKEPAVLTPLGAGRQSGHT
jgi:hypothetical protein